MIINDNKNFAFVHIQKTAGISITDVLSKISGNVYSHTHDFVIELKNPNKYFKFSFVRNPWDRLYSWYNMMINKGKHNNFSNYLLSNSSNFSEFLNCTDIIRQSLPNSYNLNAEDYRSLSFNQLDYVSDKDGKVIVDFIGKFENLNNDFDHIMSVLNIKDYRLPHINKFEHEDYRKYYNDNDIEKVAQLYQKDIQYFGYKF